MGTLLNALNFAGPAAAATSSLALGWGGAAASAAGDVAQGYGQSQMYGYQATVADNNAKLQQLNAQNAMLSGYSKEIASKMKYGALAASQKAAQATNGIDVNVGTAPRIEENTRSIGAMDAALIHFNAAQEAFGAETAAYNDQQQAAIYRMAGSNAEKAGYYKAGSSVLTAASSLLGRAAQFKLSGASGD